MAWEMSSTGLKIGLAKEIPGSIFQCIGDFVLDMLSIAPDPKNPLHMVSPLVCATFIQRTTSFSIDTNLFVTTNSITTFP